MIPAFGEIKTFGLFFLAARHSEQAPSALARCVSFPSVVCEGQCKVSVVHSHYGLDRLCCGRESRKAVSYCLYAGRAVKEEPQAADAPET